MLPNPYAVFLLFSVLLTVSFQRIRYIMQNKMSATIIVIFKLVFNFWKFGFRFERRQWYWCLSLLQNYNPLCAMIIPIYVK